MARPGVDGRTSLARSSQWLTEIGANMRKSWPSSYFEAKLKPYLQFRIWASFPGSEFRNVFYVMKLRKEWGVPTPDSRDFNLINFSWSKPIPISFWNHAKSRGIQLSFKDDILIIQDPSFTAIEPTKKVKIPFIDRQIRAYKIEAFK